VQTSKLDILTSNEALNEGGLSIFNTNQNPVLELGVDPDGGGLLEIFSADEISLLRLGVSTQGNANMRLNNGAGIQNFQFSHDIDGGGFFTMSNDQEMNLIQMSTTTSGAGYLSLNNETSTNMVVLSSGSDGANGDLEIRSNSDLDLVDLSATISGGGFVETKGPNGNQNTVLTNLAANVNHGFFAVVDANGNNQAGMFVNTDGQGEIFADITATSIPLAGRSNHEIFYAGIMGPEAAAYLRGTAELIDGRSQIVFPEHFRQMVSEESITVMLTPLSIESKGLAVIDKDRSGFEVGELLNGTGSYSFDWEIKAIRTGYEDFQVIKEKKIMTEQARFIESSDIKGN
jgi:hypothetical protein